MKVHDCSAWQTEGDDVWIFHIPSLSILHFMSLTLSLFLSLCFSRPLSICLTHWLKQHRKSLGPRCQSKPDPQLPSISTHTRPEWTEPWQRQTESFGPGQSQKVWEKPTVSSLQRMTFIWALLDCRLKHSYYTYDYLAMSYQTCHGFFAKSN